MKKWIAIPVISVLAVGVIVCGVFLQQQTTKLGDAQTEVVTLEGNVATLEGNIATLERTVSTLEGNVSTLETDLTESEATVTTLQTDLASANSTITSLQADVSIQRTINSSLSADLKKVQDPRHFSSLTELADWLHEDDTDTKYAGEAENGCYILQVRALKDGFLLPVAMLESAGELLFYNLAIIDASKVYGVVWTNDSTYELGTMYQPLPSHPLPLD